MNIIAFDNILSSKSINKADGWTGKLLAKTLSRPRTFAVDRSRARKKADMRRGKDRWMAKDKNVYGKCQRWQYVSMEEWTSHRRPLSRGVSKSNRAVRRAQNSGNGKVT